MIQDLIDRRERAMDRADHALDAAWPERIGKDYVDEMQWVARELEAVVSDMKKEDCDCKEQSRTLSNLGNVYSDLAPALGHEMLLKAKEAYLKAEVLLTDCDDELLRAKLNFNFANTLRQIDPNNIEMLQEAQRRFLSAKKIFSVRAPQFLPQVNEGLLSVDNLMELAPLINTVDQNISDMELLEKEIKEGGDTSEIIKKAHKIMKRDGGAYGLITKTQNLINQLPPELQKSEKFDEIREKMNQLTKQALGGGAMDNQNAEIVQLLKNRLEKEFSQDNVSADRSEAIGGLLGQLDNALSGDDETLESLLEKIQILRDAVASYLEMAHYLSHGIPRPPEGSRSAELVENCWLLRRFLLEEMNQPNKGNAESKEILDLNVRAAKVDKRIYDAGSDNQRAMNVDKDEFRPFAVAVRKLSSRNYSMLSQPIWPVSPIPTDTNAVFYSGSSALQGLIIKICSKLGLKLMKAPSGESIANARWKQIQKGMTTIFDLSDENSPTQAAVTYELGIALTLGKPIVVITKEDSLLPFNVDIEPIILSGDQDDEQNLASAIDRSLVRTYERSRSKDFLNTLDHILATYSRPHPNTYVDQTLRLLEDQKQDPDPVVINRTVSKFVDFLNDGETMLIHPTWKPIYPNPKALRLFHVMPFNPDWADEVMNTTRKACEAVGVTYVRGDEMDDPNVIRSIWEEIAKATHVVVDLTGFNANVALELGIVHTLGRSCLLVGQGDTVDHLFPMIAKYRIEKSYNDLNELESLVRDFLS